MTKLTVWAPKVQQLELECQGRRLAMQSDSSGYWSIDAPQLVHGIDYAVYIDGEGPFPDPGSFWQPAGVEAPSRWLDPSQFQWSDNGWQPPGIESALFYELHIGTFTPQGTFEGAIEKLKYLQELGVTHIELMPIAEFSGQRGWGYDGTALYAPHHAYGGPLGLQKFVNAAHEHGLAVILDFVCNHLGPVGNYLNKFGPYFTDIYHTPWGAALNFDGPDSDQVRDFFIHAATSWLKTYHVDGLRLDAVHAIFDRSALHFLEQLSQEIKALEMEIERPLLLIAESDLNDPRLIRPTAQGGYGLDAQWNEDFHHALHALLTKERKHYYQDFGKLCHLAKALTTGYVLDGCYSSYRHRRHGRPAHGLSAHAFVGFLQNHDQVGNRSQGERISHLVSIDQAMIGAALVLSGPFLPLLFQGEEWAASSPFLYFTDFEDPELGKAVYEGRKREFPEAGIGISIPDPQAESSFLKSKLHWEEKEQSPHNRVLAWYKSLIQLRRRYPDLHNGDLTHCKVLFDEAHQWLMLQRGSILLACNFSKTAQILQCPWENARLLLASKEGATYQERQFLLPGTSAALYAR
jgi:maltooligosyltrehalose trehalohydrolase